MPICPRGHNSYYGFICTVRGAQTSSQPTQAFESFGQNRRAVHLPSKRRSAVKESQRRAFCGCVSSYPIMITVCPKPRLPLHSRFLNDRRLHLLDAALMRYIVTTVTYHRLSVHEGPLMRPPLAASLLVAPNGCLATKGEWSFIVGWWHSDGPRWLSLVIIAPSNHILESWCLMATDRLPGLGNHI